MKFRIQVTDDRVFNGSINEWWENYDTSTSAPRNLPWEDDPQVWAQKTVDWFNRTLREGELPRRLLKVEIVDESGEALVSHSWDKVSLTGVSDPRIKGGRIFDRMRCTRCGVTGKRYTLDHITIDSKYRAKKYQHCNWAKDR